MENSPWPPRWNVSGDVDGIGGGYVEAFVVALTPRLERRHLRGGEDVGPPVHRREPIALALRDLERRVDHAERLEQTLAEEIAERLAGNHLDRCARATSMPTL